MSTDPEEEAYEQQLSAKQIHVQTQFADLGIPSIELFRSPPRHYRQRAEFRVWHQDDDSYFVMFEPGKPARPYRVDQLPAASRRINTLMLALRSAIVDETELRQRLYQVELQSTLSDEAMIIMVYHRKLDDAWEQCARQLSTRLDAKIIGRSRGQRLVIDQDHISEQFDIGERQLRYRQPEGGFTQPNAAVNQQMLGWASRLVADLDGRDLLELYCGIGNFTVVLAPHFRRVLATEVSKVSVAAARHNLQVNGADNVDLVRLSSIEVASALARERPYRRLAEIDLDALALDCVFVDPPRAGLDTATIELVQGFPNVLYISCNPESLHGNVMALSATHRIRRFALFDQFPFTPHVECGVLLERRAHLA